MVEESTHIANDEESEQEEQHSNHESPREQPRFGDFNGTAEIDANGERAFAHALLVPIG